MSDDGGTEWIKMDPASTPSDTVAPRSRARPNTVFARVTDIMGYMESASGYTWGYQMDVGLSDGCRVGLYGFGFRMASV